ncbi:HAMP domain-containing histidine kinase [Tessaracoccus sp. MC1865]|uniref:sensor histidine kinase n=1 Tax=Tessaracoccus sp. MC1865 TaxID=2760310 RepID=UPI0016049AC4|nr:HAMP domain-containing sensor histidine kinase [Tessaracoccus sp. MC1865]MBB1482732.1 HAMP domain-containing histidine kinase [Tessaracoccus sp. MC1865]QTO37820.1 HAMP domain-containing histidine kinase [Tessaracoccus sp. MC1865]
MSPQRRGSLAAQIQPRVVITVAVLALVVSMVTVFAAATILYRQLDTELDGAQVRQGRGPGWSSGDRVPGIETPGMRVGTVIALELPDGSAVGSVIEDGKVDSVTTAAMIRLVELPADGEKRSVMLPGMGKYRVEARETRLGKVSVGLPTGDIDRSLLWLTLFAAGISLSAVAVTALVTREVLGRATRPLTALTNTADQVSHLQLERGRVEVPRVSVGALPENNEVTRLATAFNDMLDRIEGALAAREASEVKLRRFVADASHELRNPLAAIRGYSELAERAPEGEKSFALQRIDSESRRMTKLVNDLLLLARLDADTQVEARPVDAVEVVVNAVSDAQAASRDHQWQLMLPEPEVMVLADADQLHQVMINLLSNARTHTPPGTVVRTCVRRHGDRAVIEVADNGPGIPPETLPRVFERFTKADDARTHSTVPSTGLGLAIVRAIAEGFGGSAMVSSRPGRTAFTVTLPLAPAD